ncbi:MAG: PAS domain S-box protein [Pseudomonas sp.]|uniref:PAS domain-containing protein n=1 Tax=Pseudomonas sp. TaxID=306 RepID=UPI00121F713E|nr:PAS domain-containing protein [Pseudomonas sp.]RZI76957.1 MAG: PAS domain S-box protein [Pseudomonas sp.]
MSIDFEALLAGSPNPYVVLDPSLKIVWMNEAYLAATVRRRDELIGRAMFEAFPSDPSSQSHRLLKASFDRVLDTRQADEIALIRYDIHNPDGSMDVRYWSATNSPVRDQNGDVSLILQHTVDVTELHGLRRRREEMGVVQRAQALQARNRDLTEESEQLRNLLEKAPGFVAVLSGPDHVFLMANEAYRSLVGGRELAGKSVAEALPEVVEQGFVNLLTRVHDTATRHVARREKVILRNESSAIFAERYLDFLYQPIFTDGGQVSGVFVQGHDVTEQVEAEEHQKLLINELNHRVKNSLAIVQSLATQSFRKATTADGGLAAFTSRLAALSSAHSLLTRGNWGAAGLADVLSTTVAATAGADTGRIRLAGPDVTLSPQVATSVAMIVHELATNAIKYGALSVPDGRVSVTWRAEAKNGSKIIGFDWSESGGPPVGQPAHSGFGTRLIQRGISADQRSSVTIDYAPRGLECRIVAHLSDERP